MRNSLEYRQADRHLTHVERRINQISQRAQQFAEILGYHEEIRVYIGDAVQILFSDVTEIFDDRGARLRYFRRKQEQLLNPKNHILWEILEKIERLKGRGGPLKISKKLLAADQSKLPAFRE